jgi:hypothetical protein
MTKDEIDRERALARLALRDPSHPHHAGVRVAIAALAGNEKACAFMRTIAPYMFDEHGQPLSLEQES